MGFIHVASTTGVLKLDVSNDLWFYFVITAPLMAATIAIWWVWDSRVKWRRRIRRLRWRREKDEDGEDLEGGKMKDV